MTLLSRLLRNLPRFSLCTHRHTYRERRKLHGVQVMHLVCERCGYAAPMVERSAREHRQVVQQAGHATTRVLRESGQPAEVVTIDRRRRRKSA